MRLERSLLLLALALPLAGCPVADDDDSVANDDDDGVPSTYSFPSRLGDGSDSVSHSGQTFRHVLIADMKSRIGGMTDRIDAGWFPSEGEVTAELDFYFSFDGDSSSDIPHGVVTDPAPLQVTYGDIASGKDLVGKLAGNDATGQHVDWSTEFKGWTPGATPESLVRGWFDRIDEQAIDWSNGTYPTDLAGAPLGAVFITEEGTDLQQLLQKFLLGAVAFSQGADDYLDDDIDGKGLRSNHDAVEDGKNYTALEHAWDEAFGYFGMSRDYGLWTDDEIANEGVRDSVNADGAIDLLSEVTWGHAQNAAKRDRCADCAAPTDFTRQAWDAFVHGRAYIASKDASLTDAEIAELVVFRDAAVAAWEKAIAATAVHYINDLTADVDAFDTAEFSFADYAKHFSELKGFALSLQFNGLSPLSDADFVELHELLGNAPDTTADYRADLVAARTLIGAAYGFEDGNVVVW
ncbi:MAG: DUF4856 domain-containing protein [Deltaproteobacteria bacterium]|nr:DUF4856 domain-containing protein [Deltaproteobacteria bacterium]